MGTNLLNHNFNKFDLKLSNYQYWDFYLHPWDSTDVNDDFDNLIDCSYIHYDFNDVGNYVSAISGTSDIISLTTWSGATNSGVTLNNIGLTGLDNGLISYIKNSGDTSNIQLMQALTGSSYIISSGTTEMIMNPVSGLTNNFIYPIEISSGTTGLVSKLCGGFYQGFYKIDEREYQVLPNRFEKGWAVEYWIKKDDTCSGVTANTLNDNFPNNEGIFFYLGTRAENKFWNRFEGNNTGATSACTIPSGTTGLTITPFCTSVKETDIFLENNSGNTISLSPPNIEWSSIDNKFLLYHRGKGGLRGGCQTGETTGLTISVSAYSETIVDERNKFLVFHRGSGGQRIGNNCNLRCNSSTGETGILACGYSGDSEQVTELDYKKDLVNNALAFRITPDFRIGYRNITLSANCNVTPVETGIIINEGYSEPNVVPDNIWTHIVVRYVANTTLNECELKTKPPRNGKLLFYINGKLKHIERNVLEIIPRPLDDDPIKQEGVPYNMSIGGGTQGLIESMTFDGQDGNDLNLELVNNFGGTFIGSLSQFKFYGCNLSYYDITSSYEFNKIRYGLD